jgi:hypothetical protein
MTEKKSMTSEPREGRELIQGRPVMVRKINDFLTRAGSEVRFHSAPMP